MGKLHQTYTLTVTTLAPLHIGTGRTLLNGFDFVTYRGRTWIIDDEALAAMIYDKEDGDITDMASGRPADELLTDADYEETAPWVRYILRGEPRSERRGAVVQEQIKDPWDRPYIPGSSLKGALRTALFYVGYDPGNSSVAIDVQRLDRRGQFAAQRTEQAILGSDPNHDLLRALQVSDSTADDQRQLQLLNVAVATRETASGAPIELEAIRKDVTFTMRLTLDGYLLQEAIRKKLNFDEDMSTFLKHLPDVVKEFTRRRLLADSKRPRGPRWRNQIQGIKHTYAALAENEFLLQLGWGGGWDSKTLGDHLTKDEALFSALDRTYRLTRRGEVGDRFPKSRRVIVRREDPREPLGTLGWIKVKMERES